MQVGFQTVALDADRGDRIGVVGMQHGAVRHRQRQILRPAAVDKMRKLDALNAPLRIKARAIGNPKRMALAGDGHVIVAVIAHLTGFAGEARGHGAGDGQRVALTFLAAKTTPHPPGLDAHRMHRQANGLGHLMLDFGGVLGGGVDDHAAILLWQGEGGLTFEVEMLLPADLEGVLDHMRRRSDGSRGVAFLINPRAFLEPAPCGERRVKGQQCLFFGVFYLALACSNAGGAVGGRDHKKHRLTQIMHLSLGQQRLVMGRG